MDAKAITSILIFAVAYVLIATEKIHKTIVVIVGATLMLCLRLISFKQAEEAVDFNVVFLLVGMMTAVSILSKTGFFQWTAICVAKLAKGSPLRIMVLLVGITAVISAFLDNVTTVVLLVPVTILIAQVLEISPIPFVILEALGSNMGGTATLIGDPPNILIGLQGGLSFNSFITNLTPVIIIVLMIFIGTAILVFRNKLKVPVNVRNRLTDAIPHLAIVDKKNMTRALIVLGGIIIAFFFARIINLEPGFIALAGAMILLVVCDAEPNEAMKHVEWGVIFFFIGLFMMTACLQVNGVIGWLADAMLKISGHNLFLTCVVILWGSAILSAVLDNIPYVMAMIPLIKLMIGPMAAAMAITDPALIKLKIAEPMWWSLALGACLGGNGTLIGASANVVSVRICENSKYHISFMKFTKYGFLFMIQSIIVCTIYIWLRYF
jgi:Na+/H+ antiporter NhaD/arsenite permease-like protein